MVAFDFIAATKYHMMKTECKGTIKIWVVQIFAHKKRHLAIRQPWWKALRGEIEMKNAKNTKKICIIQKKAVPLQPEMRNVASCSL